LSSGILKKTLEEVLRLLPLLLLADVEKERDKGRVALVNNEHSGRVLRVLQGRTVPLDYLEPGKKSN
jgi:hypothetical protein